MEKFFEKYAVALDERNALDYIHDCMRQAKKNYSKTDNEYLKDLAEVHEVIEDFFIAKSMKVDDYKED